MKLTVRQKLLGIALVATLALAGLAGLNVWLAQRVAEKLDHIQTHHVPRIRLRPQLTTDFERLARAFQDSVAAEDPRLVEEAGTRLQAFETHLTEAGVAVEAAAAAELRAAVRDYAETAADVSRRLIRGETGEALVAAITAMQAKQARVNGLIESAASLRNEELEAAFTDAIAMQSTGLQIQIWTSLVCVLLVGAMCAWLAHEIQRSLKSLTAGFERFGQGELDHPIAVRGEDELATVAERANLMAASLLALSRARDRSLWIGTGQTGLAHELRGDLTPSEVASRAVTFLARYVKAPAGALYYADPRGGLGLLGQHGLAAAPGAADAAAAAGGVPARFAVGEGLVGQAAQSTELSIAEDLPPDFLRIRSGLGEGSPSALALLPLVPADETTGVLELAFFGSVPDEVRELLASSQRTIAIAIEVARARAASRDLLAETQAQAERLVNQEEELRATNEELEAQQEELRRANEELTEQTEVLDGHRRELERKNAELEEAQRVLEQKATELATVSAYKSQFLTNMSHELRTPLNSMLLLSNLMAENQGGNLTAKQVEYSRTIHAAGSELLTLINQVLDLAKVESGKTELVLEEVELAAVFRHVQKAFEPLAREKGLALSVELEPGLPLRITADRQRVQQIVNNLVGNAVKFTERGSVSVRVRRPLPGTRFGRHDLDAGSTVAIEVTDTGPGIAAEHHERIFAAFEQVDPRTSQRYGGTGLGLAISRELAERMGGELILRSQVGKGATFVCFLPDDGPSSALDDGRRPDERRAEPTGSAGRAGVEAQAASGARILVVEDNAVVGETLVAQLARDRIDARRVRTAQAAMRAVKEDAFDCLIIDLGLPDMDGVELLSTLQREKNGSPPVIVYTARALNKTETRRLESYADAIVLKEGSSVERLLDEIRRSLGRTAEARASGPSPAPEVPPLDQRLRGRRVLVVDDDMRTVYALSAILRSKGLEVFAAENGLVALESLAAHPDVDAVLMDMMMPEMDGYTAMGRIRKDPRFTELPIIALSAKAMKGDEEKCLAAGATAYLPKPVDLDRLLQVIRQHVLEPA